jgi:hypothetical protein
MEIEVWGTFSVRDHLLDRAFVADVLLYDRLLITTCPSKAASDSWPKEWNVSRQQAAIDILGDLAIPIPWNDFHQDAKEI